MKTLIRSMVIAVVLAGIGGSVSTVAAQRVSVDVRIGTPGYHYRYYRHGHQYYRQYYRPHVGYYRRPFVVVQPRAHYYRQPLIGRRPLRAHRPHRYGYY
jgi:hypothetical protein